MDDLVQEILDSLPQRPSRSRLAPYRELIHELRRRRRTYREIAELLAERCQCKVSISTLHDFVRVRSRAKREQPQQARSSSIDSTRETPQNATHTRPSTNSDEETVISHRNVYQKVADLKQRSTPVEKRPSAFHYDPDEPLHLQRNVKKSGNSEDLED